MRKAAGTSSSPHFVEAVRLRPTLPADATLLVLNGLMPGEEEHAADLGVTPVINCLEQAVAWATEAKVRGNTPQGCDPDRHRHVSPRSVGGGCRVLAGGQPVRRGGRAHPAYEPSRLCRHAGRSGERRPAGRHAACCSTLPGLPVSLANSGGVFLGGAFHFALARPGIAVYGGAPVSDVANPMEPVVRIDIPVIQARTVPAGTAVGYGGTFVTTGETRLATLSAAMRTAFHVISAPGAPSTTRACDCPSPGASPWTASRWMPRRCRKGPSGSAPWSNSSAQPIAGTGGRRRLHHLLRDPDPPRPSLSPVYI